MARRSDPVNGPRAAMIDSAVALIREQGVAATSFADVWPQRCPARLDLPPLPEREVPAGGGGDPVRRGLPGAGRRPRSRVR